MAYGQSVVAGILVLTLAACAGGGTGPQDIQIGGSSYQPPPVGPHDLSTAERGAVQAALAAQAPGARLGNAVARRGDDGVVSVCGTLTTGAPFIGVLTENSGRTGFSPAGIAASEPEARAVRKICAERQLTV